MRKLKMVFDVDTEVEFKDGPCPKCENLAKAFLDNHGRMTFACVNCDYIERVEYWCARCDRRFNTAGELRRHRTEVKELGFCPSCEETAYDEENPLLCPICDAEFTFADDYCDHLNLHELHLRGLN
ncbi:MAG: C2H2-type zinc finger protein [Thermodesulfobacteriota bacterium]